MRDIRGLLVRELVSLRRADWRSHAQQRSNEGVCPGEGAGGAHVTAAGVIDLALDILISVGDKLRTEELMAETYVCLVRQGHPLAKRKRVTLSDYAKHRHLANTPVEFVPAGMSGLSYGTGATSGSRAALPSLLSLPAVVRVTDLVATVPRTTLKAPIDFTDVLAVDAPRELPDAVHSMWWHNRFDRDPAHEWPRDVVRAAALATI